MVPSTSNGLSSSSVSRRMRTLKVSSPLRRPLSIPLRTAFSSCCCDVTPTVLRNLRTEVLKVSSFMVLAASVVVMRKGKSSLLLDEPVNDIRQACPLPTRDAFVPC